MQIWTGKFCRPRTIVVFLVNSVMAAFALGVLTLMASACSSKEAVAQKDDVPREMGTSEDRKAIEELRKNVPEETKQFNDRLAEMLNRWKVQKTSPERLRELFENEIRKKRAEIEKRHARARDQFQRGQTDKRTAFQDKQKQERDDFLGQKPPSDKREKFRGNQGAERDRFMADLSDERNDFNEKLKNEKETFEDDIKNRWAEFRQEMPEYTRNYNEMKKIEEKEREEKLKNPPPYSGWPYKDRGGPQDHDAQVGNGAPGGSSGPGVGGAPKANDPNADVNKGGNGWPSSDMSEFDQGPGKSGH